MKFPFRAVPVTQEKPVKCTVPDEPGSWVVWSYCGVFTNPKAQSLPLVLVAFRRWESHDTVSDSAVFKRVPITDLGLLYIGSVWNDGYCRAKVEFPSVVFNLNYDAEHWACQSFQSAHGEPYPQSIYPLLYKRDQNNFLIIDLDDAGQLVIPCIEVLCGLYGWSKELVRVLATYPWCEEEGSSQNRLYGKPPEPMHNGQWVLAVRKRLINEDAVFLAHAKYSAFTNAAARSIYSEIETKHDPQRRRPAFIKVGPCYPGPAQIKVEGIPFDNDRSFLGLRIVAFSEPSDASIRATRDNSNLFEKEADENRGEAWEGRVKSIRKDDERITTLTGELEPDHGAPNSETVDRTFEILGEKQVIDWVVADQAESSAGNALPGKHATLYSSAETFGHEKSVGSASIHAEHAMESSGYLQDIWDSALQLKQDYPHLITSLEWYTLSSGYMGTSQPRLTSFNQFMVNDAVPGSVRSWVYLDRKRHTARGLLLIRFTVAGRSIHFMELQRRIARNSGESYRGLVFEIGDNMDIAPWLNTLMSSIRHTKGVFVKLLQDVPGEAELVKHTTVAGEIPPYQSVLKNAFRKMDIRI